MDQKTEKLPKSSQLLKVYKKQEYAEDVLKRLAETHCQTKKTSDDRLDK